LQQKNIQGLKQKKHELTGMKMMFKPKNNYEGSLSMV
jgi:hypothetical protein